MGDMEDEIKIIRRGRGFKKSSFGEGQLGQLASDNGAGEPIRSIEGWTIFVVGIHSEANEEDVLDRFSEFGPVKTLNLNLDRNTGWVKGYALIEYSDRKEAEIAIQETNNTEFLGQTISSNFAFIKDEVTIPRETVRSENIKEERRNLNRERRNARNYSDSGSDYDRRDRRRKYRSPRRYSRYSRSRSPPSRRRSYSRSPSRSLSPYSRSRSRSPRR